jgi:formate dehydrogenase iron-sulfur subunit
MLIDVARCVGCRDCVKACMKEHGVAGDAKAVTALSDVARTSLVERDGLNVRNLCRHCMVPSCASVCPVAALTKSELGPVVYDADKCIGCRYCMVACPFNVPRYQWNEPVPALCKCDMCFDRVAKGGKPACAEACPYEATVFGTREELIALAHERIRESPEDYHDHVYGERELGGTSILFLAPRPLDELGYRAIFGESPLPDLTRRQLDHLPRIVVGGAAVLTAVWWFTRRRDEVAAFEHGLESANGVVRRGGEHGDERG